MKERKEKEKKNKRVGWLTSLGVQLLLLILFYFIIAWKEPFPPIPEYGIELGFATSAGAPNTSASDNSEDSPVEEVSKQAPETPTVDSNPEELSSTTEESEYQEITPNKVTSPVKVSEEELKKTEAKKVEVKEPKKEVDTRAVMQPSKSTSTRKNNGSSGEDETKVDQRAIYGSQGNQEGSSDGASLNMAGWVWDRQPEPNDQSDEEGLIKYEIKVDGEGELRGIKLIVSTVSQSVERKYRAAVEKLTFSKTANYQAADLSTGTITFIVKTR